MQITLNIKNTENIENLDQNGIKKIEEIMTALVQSGGLTGVKGGQTVLHFDAHSTFMGVELNYWPWRRRKQ